MNTTNQPKPHTMKTQQTPLNTPQPDTKDVQAALDRDKAYTRKLSAVVQQIVEVRAAASDAPEPRKIRLSPERVAELEAIALKTKPTDTPAQASGNRQTSHSPPQQTEQRDTAGFHEMADTEQPDTDTSAHSPLPWSIIRHANIIGDANGNDVCDVRSPWPIDDPAFIVRACNEYEALKEELAVAKSQIENHNATLAQVRLNERHNAQRLADACSGLLHIIEQYDHFTDDLKPAREALAQWEKE